MSYIGNQPTNVAFLTDSFSGNGSTTAFTMQVAPANTSSVLVAISGVLQDPSTYSVLGTTLTFSAAPPTGTNNISVRYMGIPASGVTTTAYRTVTNFTATAGQTSFSVPSYTVGYIDVYLNGVRLAAADYTATNGTTVVLANAAAAGASVVTESFYVSSVLNAIPATAGAVNSTYLAGGSALANIGAGGLTQTYLGANVAGNGPAFLAYTANGVFQNVTNNVTTNTVFGSEAFDTGGCFNNTGSTVTLNGISTPAYAFAPNVAGYYQVNASVTNTNNTNATYTNMSLYKNGGGYPTSGMLACGLASSASYGTPSGSALVYLNGTSDYIQIYTVSNSTTSLYQCTFSASLVRAA